VLPTINGRITIDGYSQPTSTKNTSAGAFNAKLCVVLKPASGTLGIAFTVPANSFGSLTLSDLGIGGFNQPIKIQGGQSSVISGNQFGGNSGAVQLPVASINAVSFGSGASGTVIIGGPSLADRNLIGGAAFAGIDMQVADTSSFTTCTISNNLIGLAADGASPLGNGLGINNTGTRCEIAENRIAGNSITNLWLNGSNLNTVRRNRIGITSNNGGFFSNTVGILVTGSNNIIGASGNGTGIDANTVRFNGGGGVIIRSNAATGNSVRVPVAPVGALIRASN